MCLALSGVQDFIDQVFEQGILVLTRADALAAGIALAQEAYNVHQ